MVQKNIKCFFGDPKRKADSEEHAPPTKKQQSSDAHDVPCTNTSEREIASENLNVPPSTSPTIATTTEVIETVTSKTFADDSSVPSNGLNDVSPTQVLLKKFPARKFGAKSRSFSSA